MLRTRNKAIEQAVVCLSEVNSNNVLVIQDLLESVI
jgi:hypothetical protein